MPLNADRETTDGRTDAAFQSRISIKRLLALGLGPAAMLTLLALPAPEGLSAEAWKLVALTTWMVVWWMTEAVPVPVTALLPISMMPVLAIADEKDVAASYAHPLIFLFLGGFLIAAAMRRWGLHKRIALHIVRIVGSGPQGIIAGFMLATAFLSMWISNTATAVMMYAVAISMVEFVTGHVDDRAAARRFSLALLLGVAYSASIGGIGTLIGTPPNILLASFLSESYDIRIDFGTWMLIGIPFVVILLPLTWWLLCRVIFPVRNIRISGASELINTELQGMGTMSRGEEIVLTVFICTALLWIFRQLIVSTTGLPLSDTTIALLAASLLFVLPASVENGQFTIEWAATKEVPWGILLLFGGGLALANAFSSTGLATDIGEAVSGMSGIEFKWMLLTVIVAIIFLTEITSNTATTATFLPILGAVAIGLGHSPMALAIPAALAASMAFMMPVATPPNAIVFAYDDMRIADMMKAGLWLNLTAVALIYCAMLWLVPLVFNMTL